MQKQKFSYIIGFDSITVFIDGNSFTVNKQAKTYAALLDGIRSSDEVAVRNAVNIRANIVNSFNKISNKVRVLEDRIFYDDLEVTGLVASRVFDMIKLNLPLTPMVKFIENLFNNPSRRAVQELFGFMQACQLPLTDDGHFLAYKRVRADYTSVHDGKTDNSIGTVLSMPRNQVDEDANRTCSYGLHFCSYDYLQHFSGDRIVILKINPADVVAIPTDYNNAKGRAAKYEVVGEIPLNEYRMPSRLLDENFTTDYGQEVDDEVVSQEQIRSAVDDLDKVLSPSGMTLRKLRAIRQGLLDGQSYASIAAEFEISPRQVGRIDRNEAWTNLR